MPELAGGWGIGPHLAQILRGQAFFASGAAAFGSVFCRLVAQVRDEYSCARSALVDYVDAQANDSIQPSPASETTDHEAGALIVNVQPVTWVVSPLLRACGKLENCIECLHRCVELLKGLDKRRPELKIKKTLSVRRSSDRIRSFRNALQHVYDDIKRDRIKDDEPHTMQVREADFQLREHRIAYLELANWLDELLEVASLVR